MNNNTFEIFETVILQRLQKFNKEQLEGASYFLFTLHERLPIRWKTSALLDELALAELFDIISEMCTYLKTITQRYKSSQWLDGSLTTITIFRIHLKVIRRSHYTLEQFMSCLKRAITTADDLLESDVTAA